MGGAPALGLTFPPTVALQLQVVLFPYNQCMVRGVKSFSEANPRTYDQCKASPLVNSRVESAAMAKTVITGRSDSVWFCLTDTLPSVP